MKMNYQFTQISNSSRGLPLWGNFFTWMFLHFFALVFVCGFYVTSSQALLSVSNSYGLLNALNPDNMFFEGCAFVRSDALKSILLFSPSKVMTLAKLIFRLPPDMTSSVHLQRPKYSIAGALSVADWAKLDALMRRQANLSPRDMESEILKIFEGTRFEGHSGQGAQFAKSFVNVWKLSRSNNDMIDPSLLRILINAAICMKIQSPKELAPLADIPFVLDLLPKFSPQDYHRFCIRGSEPPATFAKEFLFMCLFGNDELGPKTYPKPIDYRLIRVDTGITAEVFNDCAETTLMNIFANVAYDLQKKMIDAQVLKSPTPSPLNDALVSFFTKYRYFIELEDDNVHAQFSIILSNATGINFRRKESNLEMAACYTNMNVAIKGLTGFNDLSSFLRHLRQSKGKEGFAMSSFHPQSRLEKRSYGKFKMTLGYGRNFTVHFMNNPFHAILERDYKVEPYSSIAFLDSYSNLTLFWREIISSKYGDVSVQGLSVTDIESKRPDEDVTIAVTPFQVFLRFMLRTVSTPSQYIDLMRWYFHTYLKGRKLKSSELEITTMSFKYYVMEDDFKRAHDVAAVIRETLASEAFCKFIFRNFQSPHVISAFFYHCNMSTEEFKSFIGGRNVTLEAVQSSLIKNLQTGGIFANILFELTIYANSPTKPMYLHKILELFEADVDLAAHGYLYTMPLPFAMVTHPSGPNAVMALVKLGFPVLDVRTKAPGFNSLFHLAALIGNMDMVESFLRVDFDLYNQLFQTKWTQVSLLESVNGAELRAIEIAKLKVSHSLKSVKVQKEDLMKLLDRTSALAISWYMRNDYESCIKILDSFERFHNVSKGKSNSISWKDRIRRYFRRALERN